MDFPKSPFWDFSLALYGIDGVAPACLRLQDRHGVDVNFMFFCLWHGLTRGPIGERELAARHAEISEWHELVVRHLRALRRRLKSPVGPVDTDLAQALRARVQKIEIDAEHIEQLTLAGVATGGSQAAGGSREHAIANLEAYLAFICAELDDGDRRDADLLVASALAAG